MISSFSSRVNVSAKTEGVKEMYSSLLLSKSAGVDEENFITVLQARQLLDKLYLDLEKFNCNFEEVIEKTCTLGDSVEFWDNLAVITIGIKSKRVIVSDDVKKRIVSCKFRSLKFTDGNQFASKTEFEAMIKDFAVVLQAVLKNLNVTDYLSQLGDCKWYRQLVDYYSDLVTDVCIVDALMIDAVNPSILAGISSVKKQELLLSIEGYFKEYTDDCITDQLGRSLVNYVLRQQLNCKDFDGLLNCVKEKLNAAAEFGIQIREKQYINYALGQVRHRMFD